MGAFDRLFGLGLVFAGILIAIYYTLWMIQILPFVQKRIELENYFLEPSWLFKLPALALIGGISFVIFFIKKTNAKIAAKKTAEAAKQKKQ